jgi:hypothetical protein
MSKTKFDRFKDYVNDKLINLPRSFTRKEMHEALEQDSNPYRSEKTTDHYRKAAELAGFISRVKRGIYKTEKQIPAELTWNMLRKAVQRLRYVNDTR